MKLKYKIAKTTELDPEVIIKKILLKIDEEKYGLVDVTNHSVSFDDNRRLIVGNWQQFGRLNSGKFEIITNQNSNIVVFEYYPIHVSEFIGVGFICALTIGWGIFIKAYFAGFISWIFLSMLFVKHYTLKNKAEEILVEIVG